MFCCLLLYLMVLFVLMYYLLLVHTWTQIRDRHEKHIYNFNPFSFRIYLMFQVFLVVITVVTCMETCYYSRHVHGDLLLQSLRAWRLVITVVTCMETYYSRHVHGDLLLQSSRAWRLVITIITCMETVVITVVTFYIQPHHESQNGVNSAVCFVCELTDVG